MKILVMTAALTAGLTMAASDGNALIQGVQGRPHGGNTASKMLLYRHGLSTKKHHGMRMKKKH